MIVIGTITFPETSANEVAECYKTLPEVPEFISISGTYVCNNEGEDFKAFSIFSFDDDHAEAATAYFKKRYEVFETISGLTSKHEEWLDVQDALSIVEAGTYDLKTI